ncbi:glycoside hydrolase family 3 N-terminal domain-containing protein [Georgenia sp. Z1344]|uniref:glycoside hydrolase family 3 protein n=1 Tax=Georgenia sp. Z1344 TaxID=3416706 RepID=UPI003CE92AEA
MSTTPRMGRRRAAIGAALAVPLTLTVALAGGAAATPEPTDDAAGDQAPAAEPAQELEQPVLESRTTEIIEVDGYEFRDLNDNGELDPYEDWRLSVAERTEDLVGQMTLEERAGLMLIDTLNAACVDGVRGVVPESGTDFIENQHMHRFIFRNTVTSPDDAECGEAGGGFSASTSVTPAEAAGFTNAVQEMSESTRLGIPVLFKSNARNHIDPDARAGINESAGAFTSFPKEAGIAAAALGAEAAATGEDPRTGDMSVVEDFADVMGDEWASIGLRGMYGYMADLSTEPRWYRTHETFTEDAEHAAAIMSTLVGTLQGEIPADSENGLALSPDTRVALTLKHFPGGGPQELGLDPHYAFGRAQVYPQGLFAAHMLPFEAAIDASVSSIMPYYGVPVDVPEIGNEDEDYPLTGFAFSDSIVNGLLRDQLGFGGYVNSDTGIINDRAWGLEDATVPERVAAAINGGTDTLSGFNDVQVIIDLVEDGLVTEERVDEAAVRLLEPLFRLGLFEDPYVDPDVATATIGNEENRKVGLETQRDSLVLLENQETEDGPVLPLQADSDVYILGDFTEETVESYGFDVTDGNVEEGEERPSAADSDYVLISMTASADGSDYVSNSEEFGLNPEFGVNPSVIDGIRGLDGESLWGASDACVTHGAESCTDDGLRFGGSYPWESIILDFTGMEAAESWEVTPSLETIQEVMAEVDDPSQVILQVYFRQPYVLDEESGLRDAGAILAGFGVSDTALMDVLTGEHAPQGRMPFALAGTPEAILEQDTDAPGYEETTDGALYPFGYGLTYEDDDEEPGEPVPPSPGRGFYLNDGWDIWADHEFSFGRPGDQVLVGDWDGNGSDTLAVRRGNAYFLSNSLYGGNADVELTFGRDGDTVLVGDWDGDGVDSFAVRRGNSYFLTNSLAGGDAETELDYGRADDAVLVGDYDADGIDTFAVRRGNTYYVSNSLSSGWADEEFDYGRANDEVLVGDWDGNGSDTFASRRGNLYLVSNTFDGGWADREVRYGRSGDEVFVGDWNADGSDTLGVRR